MNALCSFPSALQTDAITFSLSVAAVETGKVLEAVLTELLESVYDGIIAQQAVQHCS